MKKLLFTLALIILLVTPVIADTVQSNITLSKDFTTTDKQKRVTYDLSIPNWAQGTATLAYVLAHSIEGSCNDVIVGIGEGSFFGSEPTVTFFRDTFTEADTKFVYNEKITDILKTFVNERAYDSRWADDTILYDDTFGAHLCLKFQVVLDGFGDDPSTSSGDLESWTKRDTFLVRILGNVFDKALHEVTDNVMNPFTGTNLWWTLGFLALVIGIVVFFLNRRGIIKFGRR